MASNDSVDVVVLAGGESRRFTGGEKALATVGARSILARTVDVARQVADSTPILAVATEAQRQRYDEALRGPLRYVYDAPAFGGPVAGLESAVRASEATWVVVLGCDMPLIENPAIAWLASQRDEQTDAVVPRTEDEVHPLHAWYRRSAVQAAIDADLVEYSLRAMLDRLTVPLVSTADAPEPVRLERSLCNVNTRADLADARRMIEHDQ